MVIPNLPQILLFYLLFYNKYVYSVDEPGIEVSLPSYDELCPECLLFSIQGNTAYNFEDSMRIYRYEDNWVPIYYGTAEQSSINVMVKKSSDNYGCEESNKIYTYYPKDECLFNVVTSGIADGDAEVIWALTGATDYANKVVYDESDLNFLVVHIHQLNGIVRKFAKSKSGKWEEYVLKVPPASLTADKVEIRIHSRTDIPGVLIEKDYKYLKYSFEDGTRCLSVEYDREQILNTVASHNNTKYPDSVIFSFKGNTAFVNFKNSMNIFRFENNKWKPIIRGHPKPVHLLVGYERSTETFEYTRNGDIYTYKAKQLCLFSKVSKFLVLRNHQIIWNALDSCDYANKVVYDETNLKIILTIYHINGLISTFTKYVYGDWKEDPPTDSSTEVEDRVEYIIKKDPVPQDPNRVIGSSTELTSVTEGHSSETEQPGPSLELKHKGSGSYSEKLDAKKISQYESKRAKGDKKKAREAEIWDPSPSSNTASCGRTRVHLDLGKRESTEKFDYSQSFGFWTYTARDGYFFGLIRDGDTTIWLALDESQYALRVIAELDVYLSLVGLTLHLLNGQIKRFGFLNGELQEKAYVEPTEQPSSETNANDSDLDYSSPPADGGPPDYSSPPAGGVPPYPDPPEYSEAGPSGVSN